MKSFLFNRYTLSVVALLATVAALFAWMPADAAPSGMVIAMAGTAINISTDEQRAVFARLGDWFPANLQAQASNFIITEASLRVEQLLVNNQNTYNFDLYQGTSNTDRPLEIKLNRNDLFFATHIAIGITKYDPSKSPVWYGNYPLWTYPESNYFVGTGSSAAIEYQALETVYEGNLTFQTGNVVRFGPVATSNFKYVPEGRYLLGVASSTNTTAQDPQYGPAKEGRGFQRVTPNLVIDGQQTNIFSLQLGAGDTTNIAGATNAGGTAVNTRNVLVLQVYGFRAVNAAAAAKAASVEARSF